jgi:Spy/CpxP family protein refolding chaperone
MKKILTGLIVMLFLAVTISPALAQRGRTMGPFVGPSEYPTAFKNLNLTEEQTAKMQALREAHMKDVKPLRDELFSKRGDLKLLWLEKNPDAMKIKAKRKEIGNLRNQMEEKRDAFHLDVYNILTPEQREKFRLERHALDPSMKPHKKGFGPDGRFGPGMHGNW